LALLAACRIAFMVAIRRVRPFRQETPSTTRLGGSVEEDTAAAEDERGQTAA
jgi:hypothetical protein